MKRNKIPHFYIAIFLIIIIIFPTFSIVKIEENLYNKKYLTTETFISEKNNSVPNSISIETNKGIDISSKDILVYIKEVINKGIGHIKCMSELLK